MLVGVSGGYVIGIKRWSNWRQLGQSPRIDEGLSWWGRYGQLAIAEKCDSQYALFRESDAVYARRGAINWPEF